MKTAEEILKRSAFDQYNNFFKVSLEDMNWFIEQSDKTKELEAKVNKLTLALEIRKNTSKQSTAKEEKSMDDDVRFALLKLKSTVTFKKDLLKKGGLYPPQEEDLQIEIEILESALKKMIEKFSK